MVFILKKNLPLLSYVCVIFLLTHTAVSIPFRSTPLVSSAMVVYILAAFCVVVLVHRCSEHLSLSVSVNEVGRN
ncbi:uncharacterized protein EV420DRAFT_1569301 [Desarmillaria tabescens]|uniref:Uncharacterized protein n=1 Tax=Armillaria tabescens TaxID=1929756 RepID=A0AA39JUU1_ARMTA|nr:uncharacterized protein EV420DRAFT_1569301 [Desarmillaria tabescens]KAK0446998.1 hypothetical protein EV420DRAFT_1569301 [Desarmillaria tabescens]